MDITLEQILPYVAGSIVFPLFVFAGKWFIGDYFKKARQLEEFKETSRRKEMEELKSMLKNVVENMRELKSSMQGVGSAMEDVGTKIRKNVLDNQNVSRNIKSEVVEIMKNELPNLIKEMRS